MHLLDTNVVSEVMTSAPSLAVIRWLDGQDAADVYLSSITIAEIHYGLHAMPKGKKRNSLSQQFDEFIAAGFSHRILSFDDTAARRYGTLMAERKARGKPMSVLDGQIASIALVHNLTIVTRNTKDFEECGLNIINPFV
jgi:hypothetical protein